VNRLALDETPARPLDQNPCEPAMTMMYLIEAGDPEGFRLLDAKYGRLLDRLAKSASGFLDYDDARAEMVWAITLLSPLYREMGYEYGWLRRVALNRLRALYRKRCSPRAGGQVKQLSLDAAWSDSGKLRMDPACPRPGPLDILTRAEEERSNWRAEQQTQTAAAIRRKSLPPGRARARGPTTREVAQRLVTA
jgi:hypothetical protein